MPTITRVVQQKDQNRVNLYIDGKFAFGVTLSVATKHNLHPGKELNLKFIETLKEEEYEQKTYDKALNFISRRPRSEKEVKDWFTRKKVPPEYQEAMLNRLKNSNFVSDKEFALWWIEQRRTFRSFPDRKIKIELKAKGIKDELIKTLLNSEEKPSEVELARKTLIKKYKQIPVLNNEKDKQKVYGFLLRRGFSWDSIREALTHRDGEE